MQPLIPAVGIRPRAESPQDSAGKVRGKLGFELALVVAISFAVLIPGISGYSLVDPWETHYGEVARMMLQDHDYVHLDWPQDGEGFRSKPVLTFWMMAAGMKLTGLANDGGYSGEMVQDARTMVAIRLPFIASAVFGLTLMWWMLARLVNRRTAWLALLVVGSCPFFCLVARQGIPDMPLVATIIGALSLFALAMEDGERAISTLKVVRIARYTVAIDARHAMIFGIGGFTAVQAVYYLFYFALSPHLAPIPPAIWLPALMVVPMAAALLSPRWMHRVPGFAPIDTMRQVYLLGCYFLLGISVLAKGPPGIAVVGAVGVLYVVLRNRWRALWHGEYALARGMIVMVVTFLPWHIAMFLKEGPRFIDEYLVTHILNRAGVGVDNSVGSFEYYTSQLGHGMWLWAALIPPAIAAAVLGQRQGDAETSRERVRFLVALWAIAGTAFFSLVQTKFHHYILPIVPALGILIAFFLDDVLARRARLHPLLAALGVGIVLLICRDLVYEPERWIEMFVFRYDRPWPVADPYKIDPSDAFLVLGALAAIAVALTATRWIRVGVFCLATCGLAICLWAQMVYMPIAGTHWGMREAMRSYYEQRTVYGEKLVYFGSGEVYDDWHAASSDWSFDTFVPSNLQIGQPMTIHIQVYGPNDERATAQDTTLIGVAAAISDHSVRVHFDPHYLQTAIAPLIKDGAGGPRGRPPVRIVDADRLIAWQLYWRGENFWSGDEIWGWLPEMKTAFVKTDNAEFNKYLADRMRAPVGRRYFLISEAGRAQGVRTMLPTQRAKDSFEVIDTTSNKFAMVAFYL